MEGRSNKHEQIWKYLDGELSGAELASFKHELEQSNALQQQLEDTRALHSALLHHARNDQSTPSPDFTEKVMNRLHEMPALNSTSSYNHGLLLLGGILVAAFIGVLLVASGFFDSVQTTVPVTGLSLGDSVRALPISNISLNGKLIMKVLIGVNVLLAFLLLDRTVLRPYFGQRTH